MPKVSVILPVYNAEKYLEQAIDSILNQTFQDLEIIICDDGSTDKTSNIIASKIPTGKVVFLQNDQNCGIVDALNKCLGYAGGKYFARQDADDFSDPSRLKIQVNFLDSFPEFGVYGTKILLIDSHGFPMDVLRYPVRPTINDMMERCCVAHPTVMMRREVYEKIGGYDTDFNMNCCEDYDYWLRAMDAGFKFFNSELCLYTKRVHDESNIGRLAGSKREIIKCFDELARLKARIRKCNSL